MSEHRYDTLALNALVPDWIFPGSLVYFESDELSGNDVNCKKTIGLIVGYWILDVEQMADEEYNDLIYYDEWLLIDLIANEELYEHVYLYDLKQIEWESEECRNTILANLVEN